MNTLSIVIPIYNEEDAISEVLEDVILQGDRIKERFAQISEVEIIVVDDGSTDASLEMVSRHKNIRLVVHRTNLGYGAALKSGFNNAKGDIIGFLDADGTYPPEYLLPMVEILFRKDADVVIGSRFAGEDSRMPFRRKIGNKLFALLLSWIAEVKITDTSSGMRIFKKGILKKLNHLPDGLDFTPAMSTKTIHENLKVVDVPILYKERIGTSKLNTFNDGIRFLKAIIYTARTYNPLKFFGVVGSLILLLALCLSIKPVIYYLIVRRVEYIQIYRLFTIAVLTIAGINIITFGSFSNYTLSIVSGRELNKNSFWGRLLCRDFVMMRFGLFGYILIILSMLLNHRTIFEYITTGKIYVHWSYILTGATLFLIGMQLIMAKVTMGILYELKGFDKD